MLPLCRYVTNCSDKAQKQDLLCLWDTYQYLSAAAILGCCYSLKRIKPLVGSSEDRGDQKSLVILFFSATSRLGTQKNVIGGKLNV